MKDETRKTQPDPRCKYLRLGRQCLLNNKPCNREACGGWKAKGEGR